MKVLIVEDQEETVKDIISHCNEQEWEAKLCTFDDFKDNLDDFAPDVVVLDWKDDADGEVKGNGIFESIWLNGFKPIIIFSAMADTITLDEKYKASNLIKLQSKGDEEPVIKYLDDIYEFVPIITNLKDDFNQALIEALNSITMMNKAKPISDKVMRYVFAKRVSSFFDKECNDEKPPAWIQYTYPPITKTMCVGDIIRVLSSGIELDKPGNPEEYKIVLTPSCDIAQENVTHILCANCLPKNAYHDYPMTKEPSGKHIERIVSHLNDGYKKNLVPLPEIPNILPYMTVNLKYIELIPLEKIAINQESINPELHTYFRVSSVDSPFREQIVWSHMINSCRPGMPNRDMNTWAKELIIP